MTLGYDRVHLPLRAFGTGNAHSQAGVRITGTLQRGVSAPAERVVEEMVAHKVHRLYVADGAGILLGVIGAMDVLRHLQAETSLAAHQA